MTTPHHTYFVCATPRSGSTLFCEALTATGVAGRPAEYFEALRGTNLPRQPQEYFTPLTPEIEALLPTSRQEPAPELANAPTYAAYLDWVREQGTTPNGVFGAKLMYGYLGELVGRLREIDRPRRKAARIALLEHAFPGARYVRVIRRGKVEQAVSLWTAIQTQAWRAEPDTPAQPHEPVFHHGAIDHLVRLLNEHEHGWTTFFANAGIEPHPILYEELVADWDATLRATLAFLDIEPPPQLPAPPLQRQSDARSQEWVERFLSTPATAR